MAPFNFAQRSSSRTAIKMQPEELKMDKLSLSSPTAPSSTALKEAPGSRFGGKMSQSHGTFEPSKAFVRQLAAKSEYRCVRMKRPLIADGWRCRSCFWPDACPTEVVLLHVPVDS